MRHAQQWSVASIARGCRRGGLKAFTTFTKDAYHDLVFNVSLMIRFRGVRIPTEVGLLEIPDMDLPTDRRCLLFGPFGKHLINAVTGACQHEGTVERRCQVSFPAGYTNALLLEYSLLENVSFCCEVFQRDREAILERLDRFDFRGHYGKILGKLPFFSQVKFSYAVCLCLSFDYYVFISQTAVGDVPFRLACNELLPQRYIIFRDTIAQASILADCGIVATASGPAEYYDNVADLVAKTRAP